jgi:hypothetical protein
VVVVAGGLGAPGSVAGGWRCVCRVGRRPGSPTGARRAGWSAGAIRKGKTDQKVSVGTEVQSVAYTSSEEEIRSLRLVERDLKAAVRAGALTLAMGEPMVVVTLKPVEA